MSVRPGNDGPGSMDHAADLSGAASKAKSEDSLIEMRRNTKSWLWLSALCAAFCACGGERVVSVVDGGDGAAAPDAGAVSDVAGDAGADAGTDGGDGGGAGNVPTVTPGCDGERTDSSGEHRFFAIRTVDAKTGAPAPGVRLTTTNEIVFTSDKNGLVAFYEPGLMDTEVWFGIGGEGYDVAEDWLGFKGIRLMPVEGGFADVPVDVVGPVPEVTLDDDTRLLGNPVPTPGGMFCVTVLDRATGRGVPLVEVGLGNSVFMTDSAGRAAVMAPSLLGTTADVSIRSHGYYPFTAPAVELNPGNGVTIRIRRRNMAQRIYRVTGQGIYRDSVLLGFRTPLARPIIAGLVMGQDSVLSAIYRGKVFWVWGDTNRPAYPLGNFHSSGAVSDPAGLDPAVGVDLEYFVGADGFSREMAPLATIPGEGLTWLGGLVAVPDDAGVETLTATFGLFPGLADPTKRGVARFDDAQGVFVEALVFTGKEPVELGTHPYVWESENGGRWLHYVEPVRTRATVAGLLDPAVYEAFTPLDAAGEVVKDAEGNPVYAWRNAPVLTSDSAGGAGVRDRERIFGHETDIETAEHVEMQAGSSAWNVRLGRFLRIQGETGGTSWLGELWLLVGDTPVGPWVHARKVVSHDHYTCYNPRHHPFFDAGGGHVVFFECTYTTSFSDAPAPTPRYDYNQAMYMLDLDAPEAILPVPVYRLPDGTPVTKGGLRAADGNPPIAFFALDRELPGAVPVGWREPACANAGRKLAAGSTVRDVLFFAFPKYDAKRFPGLAVTQVAGAGSAEVAVWPSPVDVRFPVGDYLSPLRADAGADFCVDASSGEGALVTLDGSASRVPAHLLVDARWSWSFDGKIATGPRTTVRMGAGTYAVTLTIETRDGAFSRDTLLVHVGE
jgi:hypothetical protein